MNTKIPLKDIDEYTAYLRQKSISQSDKYLITDLKDSEQEKDITLGLNCSGLGRIHHFRYSQEDDWIPNPLPHHVAAWKMGYSPKDTEIAQVFQFAACNCRCWYCFVDKDLLSANQRKSKFINADELIELFLKEKIKPYIIDISGGQPDITPEWSVNMMKALNSKNLQNNYYLWQDDNLTTYYPWNYLSSHDFKIMKDFKNYGRVGCFKGFSPKSFQENTTLSPQLFSRQIDILSKWVKMGIDTYGYITLTSSDNEGVRSKLSLFMDSIQEKIHPMYLLLQN